jgi:hypothetical protein
MVVLWQEHELIREVIQKKCLSMHWVLCVVFKTYSQMNFTVLNFFPPTSGGKCHQKEGLTIKVGSKKGVHFICWLTST